MRRQWFSFGREGKGHVSGAPGAAQAPAPLPPPGALTVELKARPRPGPRRLSHSQGTSGGQVAPIWL